MYTQPYQKFYINILETVTLSFILIMLIIVSTRSFEASGFLMYSTDYHTHIYSIQCLVKIATLILITVEKSTRSANMLQH